MSGFRKGDRVRCVDARDARDRALLLGGIYTVTNESGEGVGVTLAETGPECFWFADRFERVEPETCPPTPEADDADVAMLRAENALLREALSDMTAGWRYIRMRYGDLDGVGWDRAQGKAETALSLSSSKLTPDDLVRRVLDGWLAESGIEHHGGAWYQQSLGRMRAALESAFKPSINASTPSSDQEAAP